MFYQPSFSRVVIEQQRRQRLPVFRQLRDVVVDDGRQRLQHQLLDACNKRVVNNLR